VTWFGANACPSGEIDSDGMAPAFFDTHVCSLPSSADLIGREMDFDCSCGRRWRLEHYIGKDGGVFAGLLSRYSCWIVLAGQTPPVWVALGWRSPLA
jgi:hypothetical protein